MKKFEEQRRLESVLIDVTSMRIRYCVTGVLPLKFLRCKIDAFDEPVNSFMTTLLFQLMVYKIRLILFKKCFKINNRKSKLCPLTCQRLR
jgi:hypothetical protein